MNRARWILGLVVAGLVLGTSVFSFASAAEQDLPTYGQPALQAIDQARAAGEISRSEALLYRLYYVVAPDLLPAEFALPGPGMKDGTGIVLEVLDEIDGMPDDIRAKVQALLVRPALPNTRETTHFIVHYDPAYTSETYVDVVAGACETSWTEYHTNQIWNVPPGDGVAGGGTNMIDCYIHELASGILGMAQTESPVLIGGAPNDYTGYFHISHVIGDVGLRQATVAHEYMHVVQFGYSRTNDMTWWLENCAMQGEDWAFDDVNEYLPYLPPFYNNPPWPLDTYDGSYEYAQISWPMYLSERFYHDAVENIWEEMKWLTSGSFWTASNTVLAPYGNTYETAYLEFMRWNYYTGSRDDDQHFEEGKLWSVSYAVDRAIALYPSGEKHPRSTKLPERLGTSVMLLRPVSADNTLQVTFNGPIVTLGVEFIVDSGEDTYTEYFMTLDANADGVIQIPQFNTCSNVHMLTSMKRIASGGQDYAFWAETLNDASDVAELNSGELIRIHPNRPNPFHTQTAVAYTLNTGADVRVRVVDASGRQVRNLYSGVQRPGNYEITWNRQDDAGHAVASGVYYAVVRVGGVETTRQMTVVE